MRSSRSFSTRTLRAWLLGAAIPCACARPERTEGAEGANGEPEAREAQEPQGTPERPEAPEPKEPGGADGTASKAGAKPPGRRPKPRARRPGALPEGFALKGTPRVEEPFFTPTETWRFLVSRLTTLQGDAQARGEEVLVTLEPAAMHVTDRAGARVTWLLPEGLRLEGGPAHVLLGADLSLRCYRPDGTQAPEAEEVTLVTARARDPEGPAEVFRLVVKGGRLFRSISTPG